MRFFENFAKKLKNALQHQKYKFWFSPDKTFKCKNFENDLKIFNGNDFLNLENPVKLKISFSKILKNQIASLICKIFRFEHFFDPESHVYGALLWRYCWRDRRAESVKFSIPRSWHSSWRVSNWILYLSRNIRTVIECNEPSKLQTNFP